MNILLLYGGESSEHEVSCRSAKFIYENLLKNGHTVYLAGISKRGKWYLLHYGAGSSIPEHLLNGNAINLNVPDNEKEEIEKQVWTVPSNGIWHNLLNPVRLPIDLVFPIVHGFFGEDGALQNLIAAAKTALVGCDAMSSLLCMNKLIAKKILREASLPVLPDIKVDRNSVYGKTQSEIETLAQRCLNSVALPLVVKPSDGGSSIGIFIAHSKEELIVALQECARYTQHILLEPFLQKKRELEVSVIGNNVENTQSFGPGEIILHTGTVYDYNLKYHSTEKEVGLVVPAELSCTLCTKIQNLAMKAYTALGCSGFARIDFFLYDKNMLVINEINTLPGFTSISMFPKLILEAGISAEQLIQTLVELGVENNKN